MPLEEPSPMSRRTDHTDGPSGADPQRTGAASRGPQRAYAARAVRHADLAELRYRMKAAEWMLMLLPRNDRRWADHSYTLIWYYRCYLLLHHRLCD